MLFINRLQLILNGEFVTLSLCIDRRVSLHHASGELRTTAAACWSPSKRARHCFSHEVAL